MASSQIVPRVLSQLGPTALAHPPLWLAALPPTWFGALDVLMTHGAGSWGVLGLAALGVVATGTIGWVGITRLAATYAHGLVTLNEAAPTLANGGERGLWIVRIVELPLIRAWMRDPVERAVFRLTLANATRARGVKLRVYPALAQFLIYPVVMLFSIGGGPGGEYMLPFGIAMGGAFIAMLPSTVLETLRFAEDYLGAELFRYLPLARPAALFHGARKAVVLALCGPGLLFVGTIAAVWLHDRTLLLLLLPGTLAIPLFSLFPAIGRGFVPFAMPVETQAHNTTGCLLTMAFTMSAFALAGVAAFAWHLHWFHWLLLAETSGVVLLTWLARGHISRQSLPALEQ